MPKKYSGIFASSTDSSGQTLSLTISSFIQGLISVLVTIGVVHAVDGATLTGAVQQLIAQIAIIIPAALTAYHSVMLIWGIVRKFIPHQ